MRTIVILLLTLALITKANADALDTWAVATNSSFANQTYGDFTHITFGGGAFMAISGPPTSLPGGASGTSTSSNGLYWLSSGFTAPSEYDIDGVAFGNGTFVQSVSLGDGGSIFWNSGTNSGEILNVTQLNCVTFGNGIFVAAGFDYEGGDFGAAYVSTNGQTWSSEIEIANGFYPDAIASGNDEFVAVGHSFLVHPQTNSMFYSPDGYNWTDLTPYIGFSFSGISFVNGLFATLGPGGYYTSPDPSFYEFTAAGSINPSLYVPTSGTNHLYVSVGTNGGVYTSTNRTNWTQRTTGITNNLNCIAYGDNRFVAAGAAGGIFVSGSTIPSLTVQNQSPNGVQLSLTGGLGPTYQLQASSDLSSWTNLVVFTNIGTGTNFLDTNTGNFTQRYYRTVSP